MSARLKKCRVYLRGRVDATHAKQISNGAAVEQHAASEQALVGSGRSPTYVHRSSGRPPRRVTGGGRWWMEIKPGRQWWR